MDNLLIITSIIEGHGKKTTVDTSVNATTALHFSYQEHNYVYAHLKVDDGALSITPQKHFAVQIHDDTYDSCVALGEYSTLQPCVLTVFPTDAETNIFPSVRLRLTPSSYGLRTWRKYTPDQPQAHITIGSGEGCDIVCKDSTLDSVHCDLFFDAASTYITARSQTEPVQLNGTTVAINTRIDTRYGDVLSIGDFSIAIGSQFISMNCPPNIRIARSSPLREIVHKDFLERSPMPETSQKGPLSFFPSPRLLRSIHRRSVAIDAPPAVTKPDDTPVLMQIGPSFLMGFSSFFMIFYTVSRMREGATWIQVAPQIAMSVSMMAGMILWPFINRFYMRRKERKDERKRHESYTRYLNRLEADLAGEIELQSSILRENRVDTTSVIEQARVLSPHLMNRSPYHADFFFVRLGVGSEPLDIDLTYPNFSFSMDTDNLSKYVEDMQKNQPVIENVPVGINITESPSYGIIAERKTAWSFLRGLLIQICGLYSYSDIRVVMLSSDDDEEWAFLKRLSHTFTTDKRFRFIAKDRNDVARLDRMLASDLEKRLERNSFNSSYASDDTFYVIVCPDRQLLEQSATVQSLLKLRQNVGMTLVFLAEEIRFLPRECLEIIELPSPTSNDTEGKVFTRDDITGTTRLFRPDIYTTVDDANVFANYMARAVLPVSASEMRSLPESLGFLEMFEAGNIEQFSITQHWRDADASRTIAAQIGVDDQAQPFMLDLHEDYHGPHGLIAGTTGSGKSEFIITYVLSLAATYPPDQVAFVLIDYKGGGLAGAFANDRYNLPHLAGTITNLDGAAIARSLVSIKSELQRRQRVFNEARERTGEPTMDIYKYLSYYRQGVLSEQVPHLFLIADEFAELKQQEPEFMDELISAARIGRSLGVHLILATQKPSGVVNDQIWSNSRFKISLKVADASDSKEMIRRDDAAQISNPGRFFMLVGYNESFSAGQSAYTGTKYAPVPNFEPKKDDAVTLMSSTGEAILSIRPPSEAHVTKESELNVTLDAICDAAEAQKLVARPLWLPSLPEYVSLDYLFEHYEFEEREPASLVTALGLIDNPSNQSQYLYTLDIAQANNVAFYGSVSSGIDAIANSALACLIRNYTPEEFIFYAVDCGSGILSSFREAPHCGGVTLEDDTTATYNLFSYIRQLIDQRRTLFAPYGGNYASYYRASKLDENLPSIPRIGIVISNIAAFYEFFPILEDTLTSLAREAPRFGIHFLVIASTPTDPQIRIRSLFGQSVVASFSQEDDFNYLLGSLRSVVLPTRMCQGLVEEDEKILTYQGAQLGNDPSEGVSGTTEVEAIRDICQQVAADWEGEKAPAIPMVPDVVYPHTMPRDISYGRAAVPVGYATRNVSAFTLDTVRIPSALFTSNDSTTLRSYALALLDVLDSSEEKCLFVDDAGILEGRDSGSIIRDMEEFSEVLEEVKAGSRRYDIICFTSIMTTLSAMDNSRVLEDYIERQMYGKTTSVLLISEAWKMNNIYDSWYRIFCAGAQFVWIGPGHEGQSIVTLPLLPPEDRLAGGSDTGFSVIHGVATRVKVMQQFSVDGDDDAETFV